MISNSIIPSFLLAGISLPFPLVLNIIVDMEILGVFLVVLPMIAIIHFEAQIVPNLASENPFQLAPLSLSPSLSSGTI